MKKRIFDIVFSLTFLIAFFPLYIFLYFLVKGTSKGPAFYKSMRMGKKGELIWCWKFRTMVQDADQKLKELLEKDPTLLQEWKTYHKLQHDPRLTQYGKFLRKTSLDEFPQFWNVLKGDISVVGPRPLDVQKPETALEEMRAKYHERTEKILSVRPGLVSLWQIRGRNLLTLQERAALEEEYVETQSFWLDLKIICKTISILLFPKGAY